MWFLDCPFLDRDWSRDRRSIERTFSSLVDERIPVWLVSFPEGTRQTGENREESRRYARDQGIEPFEHVLLPRTKGFCATVQGLRGHVQAVYDLTLGFERGVPTLWQFMRATRGARTCTCAASPPPRCPRTTRALALAAGALPGEGRAARSLLRDGELRLCGCGRAAGEALKSIWSLVLARFQRQERQGRQGFSVLPMRPTAGDGG
jgi:hypothetical protein